MNAGVNVKVEGISFCRKRDMITIFRLWWYPCKDTGIMQEMTETCIHTTIFLHRCQSDISTSYTGSKAVHVPRQSFKHHRQGRGLLLVPLPSREPALPEFHHRTREHVVQVSRGRCFCGPIAGEHRRLAWPGYQGCRRRSPRNPGQ